MTTRPHTSLDPTIEEDILDATEQLIYAQGIHATGIDAIVRQSGVARKSVYRHFHSKEELVAAALTRRDQRWMAWFSESVEQAGGSPRARLLRMFHVLQSWFSSDGFHGCAFLNAAGEIGARDHPIRRVSRRHKANLLGFIRLLCVAYDPKRAAILAPQLLVLVDGAISVALVSGNPKAAVDACAMAKRLL